MKVEKYEGFVVHATCHAGSRGPSPSRRRNLDRGARFSCSAPSFAIAAFKSKAVVALAVGRSSCVCLCRRRTTLISASPGRSTTSCCASRVRWRMLALQCVCARLFASSLGLLIRRSLVRAQVGEPPRYVCVLGTSVTFYSGHTGNTLASNGLAMGSRRVVSSSKRPKSKSIKLTS